MAERQNFQTQYGMQQNSNYGTQQQPVMMQPYGAGAGSGKVTWMPPVGPLMGCPPGMEYLTQLDQLLIKQETQLLEVVIGWECKNRFSVLNSLGQQVYYAMEESSICQRMCCGPARGFVYHIVDNTQQEIFRVRRDFECCTGMYCCPSEGCRYYGAVETRDGDILGYVSNLTFCCSPRFGIFDSYKSLVAEIAGPCCPIQTVCCTDDIDYPIFDTSDGSEIGKISKQWPGLLKEMFTDSDNFRVSFPVETDVKKKALMLGAIFIIDIMLYERRKKNNR